MKYFLPDSQDLIDPSFDFEREVRSVHRIRQRDDNYAHEVFSLPPYDGILVSKGTVDGRAGGRYSMSQRIRLLRVGAPRFFRLDPPSQRHIEVMGDCGAFSYIKEPAPPYSVDEVIEFYTDCDFDYGISVDHVILGYHPDDDPPRDPAGDGPGAPGRRGRAGPAPDQVARQALTLELAADFLRRCRRERPRFQPIGVAQGWSPRSYAHAVATLQAMGYRYIALGGMVPLKTPDILATLACIGDVRRPETRLHLLGVTRLDSLSRFRGFGVASLDSTSPLRQAFKHDKENYYTMSGGTYQAIRLPQVESHGPLQKRIRAGQVAQESALALEQGCLAALRQYDEGRASVSEVVAQLVEYEALCGGRKDRSAAYREVLERRPWRQCGCEVCQALGYHVILFRGAERNRRRGFHNTWVFYRRLRHELAVRGPNAPEIGEEPALQ